MPISQFLIYLEKNKRYSLHTLKAYETDLVQLEIFLDNSYETNILFAESQMIRSWIIELIENKIQNKSINRKISTIKSFYNYCLKEEIIKKLPTLKLITPKVAKTLPIVVKEKEMINLLNDFKFENTVEGRRDALIIELLYSCGLRLSELINIKIKDFDIYNSTLKVLGKRNKERIVPLHKVVFLKIQDFIKEKNILGSQEEMLLTNSGKKMYPKFVYRKVNYYLGQVTTSKKKSPHILRHTFATHMLNNGADLNTIKEILGHANLSATEVYTHNTIEKLKKSYNLAHPRA